MELCCLGGYYGIIIIVSTCLEKWYIKWRKKHNKIFDGIVFQLLIIVRTFIIVVFGYGLFTMDSLTASFYIFKSMFTNMDFSNAFLLLWTKKLSLVIVIFGLFLLVLCDAMNYWKNISVQDFIVRMPLLIRWGMYLALAFLVIFLGNFDKGAFLYFEF